MRVLQNQILSHSKSDLYQEFKHLYFNYAFAEVTFALSFKGTRVSLPMLRIARPLTPKKYHSVTLLLTLI